MKRGEEAEAKMGVQVTALNENVATLKREWQGSQRRVGELEKQTDELRGELAVLEATVQNNQDERRALLERCVSALLFDSHCPESRLNTVLLRVQPESLFIHRNWKTRFSRLQH